MASEDKKKDTKESGKKGSPIPRIIIGIFILFVIIGLVRQCTDGNPGSDRPSETENDRRMTQVTQVINAIPRYDQLIETLDPGGETEEIRISSGRRYCVDAWDPELIQIIHRDRFGIEHEHSPGDPEATYDIMSYRIQNVSDQRFEIETYQVPFGESCSS